MRLRSTFTIGCLLFAVATCAHGFPVDMDFDGEVKATSEYLWRGEIINDDWCIQPRLTAEAQGFSLDVLGNWDLTSVTNASESTRMDVTLAYKHMWDNVVIGRGGVIAYIYKESLVAPWHKDTYEAFLGSDFLVFLLPTFRVYYDFGEIGGVYATAGLRHSFNLIPSEDNKERKLRNWSWDLDLKADVGMANKNYNEKVFDHGSLTANGASVYEAKNSLVDFTGEASLPVTINKNIMVIPCVKYMTLIDSGIKDSQNSVGEKTDGVACSLTLGVSF
jgi:hypothetical protein